MPLIHIPKGVTPWALLSVNLRDITDQEREEAEGEARDLQPRLTAQRKALDDATANIAQLSRTLSDVMEAVKLAEQELFTAQTAAADEIIDCPAADSSALAEPLRPLLDKRALLDYTKYHLEFRRMPAARIAELEGILQLRKLEASESVLLTIISHARTMATLGAAFAEEGEVGFIGKRTTTLREIAIKKLGEVRQAENELQAEINRQAAAASVLLSQGTITSQQIRGAVPAFQAAPLTK